VPPRLRGQRVACRQSSPLWPAAGAASLAARDVAAFTGLAAYTVMQVGQCTAPGQVATVIQECLCSVHQQSTVTITILPDDFLPEDPTRIGPTWAFTAVKACPTWPWLSSNLTQQPHPEVWCCVMHTFCNANYSDLYSQMCF